MPITRRVKPEPRTPASQADDGGADGCFVRGGREAAGRAAAGFDGADEDLAAGAFVEGSFAEDGFEPDALPFAPPCFTGGEGVRGALPGAEGRRGGRAMGGCLLERDGGGTRSGPGARTEVRGSGAAPAGRDYAEKRGKAERPA